jgi:branched-chain amino acid transport system ATP-binding protein
MSGSDGTGPETARPLLEVENLTKEFGGLTAVYDLSFEVEDREILGFIGPNGAGKSTTFDCIFGIREPTSGTVRFKGEDVTGFPPYRMRKKGMARTFQTFRPLNDRDVVSNVGLSMVSDSLFTVEGLFGRTEEAATDVCRRVGLEDDLYKMPDELPHAGMIRLEIARAIATPPEIVLVDEPFAGLTDAEVEQLSQLFLELRDDGVTFVIVDHNMRGLLDLIDRCIVINFGELIAEGPPDEIVEDETVQEAYLGGEGV